MAMLGEDGTVRVIEGPDAGDQSIEGYEVEKDVFRSWFKKFIREYKFDTAIGSFKYREQLQQNCGSGFYKLEVNLNHLVGDHNLAILRHNLMVRPNEFVPVCEQALEELYTELVKRDGDDLPEKAPKIQLILQCDLDIDGSFGTMKPLKIRDLVSDAVEKLVVIKGIVISVKKFKHKANKVALRCKNCEQLRYITIPPGFCGGHVPTQCDGGNLARAAMEKCPPNPYVVEPELCETTDEQIIRLQELPEDVPVGEMPRAVDLTVHQYLVDNATPGTRMTAIGIFCATEHGIGEKVRGAKRGGVATVKYSYVRVLGVQVGQGGKASLSITPEEEEQFERMAKDPQIRKQVVESIAPAILSSAKDNVAEVKKAVASLLFGGSRKYLPDGTRMRGDINVLLLGDPGTAKSQFLKFGEKAAPIAVYTSGKGSSAAGLTAAIVQDKNGFSLEGGAMVLADEGIVCIDEFDKMDVKDRVAIHEAMEQQTISIAKAGITTMLNTRCSVLAAANPKFGSYDDLTSTADQMDFEATILSRFDMMFLIRDVRDQERDFDLARHICSIHKGDVKEDKEGPLNVTQLRKYISYCKSRCSPRMTPDASEVLKNHYISIRAAMKGESNTIPITVRQLEAIIRISESLAKMELCDDVNIGHVEEAIRMFTASTLDAGNRDRGVGINEMNDTERDDIRKAEEQIRRLIPLDGRKDKFQLLSLLVSTAQVDEKIASRAIYIMVHRGELEEMRKNTLVRRAGRS